MYLNNSFSLGYEFFLTFRKTLKTPVEPYIFIKEN